jgi:D-glycero-D-manno-heptose 1,7-bisphosphate phosphatase
MNSALFLDRDGVINIDHGYVHKKENFHFIDNIFDLVTHAKNLGHLVIIVTNQAGIAKGIYTEQDFQTLMSWVSRQFICNHGKIDKTYFCPFHKDGIIKKYAKNSPDRKPEPGMIIKACKEFNIDPKKSVLVGNKLSDIEAANSSFIGKSIYFGDDECKEAYASTSNLLDIKKELIF